MKYLYMICLMFCVTGCVVRSAEKSATSAPPVGVLVDSIGGIYWARAPTGYYCNDGVESIKQGMKEFGLDDTEVPRFKVEQAVLVKIYSAIPESDRKVDTGKMAFIFTFFYGNGRQLKRTVLKNDLKRVIELLPPETTARLKSMFEIADKANNPN